jgi:hypothetical protein
MNPELLQLLSAMLSEDPYAADEFRQTIELNALLNSMEQRHRIEETIARSRNPQAAEFYAAIDRARVQGAMQGYGLK